MRKSVIMFSVLCAFLTSCRLHEYCEYKSVEKEMLGGRLSVGVWSGQAKKYTKGRREYAVHGFPYTLEVGLSVDSFVKFSGHKFVLRSLTATGVDTGKVVAFDGGEKEFTKVRVPNVKDEKKPGYSGFRFLITEDMGVTYEPFDIEADMKVIHSDGTEKSEHIKVRLEKDYKKKRQSDTLDFMESV